MKELQLTQNRLLRVLNGSKIKDKISLASMLKRFNLLSINQLSAQIKLVEVWKIANVMDHPLSMDTYSNQIRNSSVELRPQPSRMFNDSFRLHKSSYSFNVDTARLWNLAPIQVQTAPTLSRAKAAILAFVTSLPVWWGWQDCNVPAYGDALEKNKNYIVIGNYPKMFSSVIRKIIKTFIQKTSNFTDFWILNRVTWNFFYKMTLIFIWSLKRT